MSLREVGQLPPRPRDLLVSWYSSTANWKKQAPLSHGISAMCSVPVFSFLSLLAQEKHGNTAPALCCRLYSGEAECKGCRGRRPLCTPRHLAFAGACTLHQHVLGDVLERLPWALLLEVLFQKSIEAPLALCSLSGQAPSLPMADPHT